MSEADRRGIDDAERWKELCDTLKIFQQAATNRCSPAECEVILLPMQLKMKHIELQRLGEIASALENCAAQLTRVANLTYDATTESGAFRVEGQ